MTERGWKNGYIAVVQQSRDDDCACAYRNPKNQFQHGWNAGVEALHERDRRHERDARAARERENEWYEEELRKQRKSD